MCETSVRTKPKFGRLHTMLGISPAHARGLLEFLWDSVCDTGDPDIGDADAIEMAAGWTGEPGKLCQALLTCGGGKAGFIEEIPGKPGLYRLHDLIANSPPDLVRKWVRRAEREERGRTIAELRMSAARAKAAKDNAPCMASPTCHDSSEMPSCQSKEIPASDAVHLPAKPNSTHRGTVRPSNGRQSNGRQSNGRQSNGHDRNGNHSPQQGAAAMPSASASDFPTHEEVMACFRTLHFVGDPAAFLAEYHALSSDAKDPNYRMPWHVYVYFYVREQRIKRKQELEEAENDLFDDNQEAVSEKTASEKAVIQAA